VVKSDRRLHLHYRDRLKKTYRIALGFNPRDDKSSQGDGCTPEGEFTIVRRNPNSSFHKSLLLNYPSLAHARAGLEGKLIDRATYERIISAQKRGQIPPQNTRLGGDIFLHGGGAATDWTLGCVAVENTDMDELFRLPLGTKVIIRKDPD